MQREITRLSKRLRGIYETEVGSVELPHFTHFPSNCCLLASLYLGVLIVTHFPRTHVNLIHGYNPLKHENHYWLDVNGFSYDITADQFDEVTTPLYAGLSNPLSSYFTALKSSELMQYFSEYKGVDEVIKLDVLHKFETLLAQAQPPY